MKWTLILSVAISLCASSYASDLSKALFKAGAHECGSKEWYQALSLYVERDTTNSLGRINKNGLSAIRVEYNELKTELLKLDIPLDLKTELSLCDEAVKSDKIRDLPKFLIRLSRVCALVERIHSEGLLKDSVHMFRWENLELFVLHHGVRAYIKDDTQQSTSATTS